MKTFIGLLTLPNRCPNRNRLWQRSCARLMNGRGILRYWHGSIKTKESLFPLSSSRVSLAGETLESEVFLQTLASIKRPKGFKIVWVNQANIRVTLPQFLFLRSSLLASILSAEYRSKNKTREKKMKKKNCKDWNLLLRSGEGVGRCGAERVLKI